MIHESQRGAVGIALLALSPLLVASGALSAAVFLTLKAHADSLHQCRAGLLDIENARLARLRLLTGLNPQARRLRRERASAEMKLKLAGTSGSPPAIAAAKAGVEAVKARQLLLHFRQRGLLARVQLETKTRLARLRADIGSGLERKFGDAARDARAASVPTAKWRPLAVRRDPDGDLTPDFFPAERFEERQAIRISWRVRPAARLPSWLGFDRFRNLDMGAECGTTAERKTKNTWRARLDAGKP